ncbi:MAG: hypothetical protein AAB019_01405 [Planctomycetota bacterium]
MTTKRLIIIIILLTALGLITAWQQIQTVRYGYKITTTAQSQNQLLETRKNLEVKLAEVKSPENLVIKADALKIMLTYPKNWNIVDLSQPPEKYAHIFQKQNNNRLPPDSRQVANKK